MIVFINFSGNPLHALGGLLLCVAINVLFEYLTSSHGDFLWLELAASVLGLLLTGGLLAVASQVIFNPRGRAGMWRTAAGLFGGGGGGAAAAAAAQGRQQHARTPQQRQQRWDQVVKALQKLPTDTVVGEQELQQLSTVELKERLQKAGGDCSQCLEKQELVKAVLEIGGSSSGSCCICCEDYSPGDVLRVLPCKHRFHIECVDKWFLSSTDYSRAPACPMCNAELLLT